MNIYMLILIIIIIMVFEIMPLKQKKQSREIIVLLMIGAITLAYGYYYNTHEYNASLINLIFHMLRIR